MKKSKMILRFLILILGFILIGIGLWRAKNPAVTMNSGTIAPKMKVGDFRLTNQKGKTITLEDLKGHPWVANFIFTRCMGPCPIITLKTAAIEKELKTRPQIRFVSFSVDPDYDTPEVLKEYTETYKLDTSRWDFLTGSRDEIYDLIRTSFKLAVGEEHPPSTQILHSVSLVLVDENGYVQHMFNSSSEEDLAELKKALANL